MPLGIAPARFQQKTSSSVAPKEPDPTFSAKLRKDIAEKVTTAGLEEFLTQLDVIDDDVADRRQAVSMTLKSLERVQKISRQQVIASVRERLAVLENARVVFEEQIAEESQQATVSRRQALQDATSHVADLERQLEEAKRARALAEQSVNELSNMVSEVRARFESAHEPLMSEFSRLLSEVNQ
ncbi:hypothetical protein IPJ70_02565 [Candidatus Campbellbacteria bacterium]|nr:MAG: hypothetical protein IPJ70_02565 [Candidatus Campbellbacteria bacterium]